MKKITLLAVLLLLFCSNSQAQTNSSTLAFSGYVRAIIKAPDGSTYVGGIFTSIDGVTRNRLAKINANGTLDSSFNPNVSGGAVLALALDASGNLYVGGGFTKVGTVTRNRLAKINADGTLNTSFNPNMNTDVNTLALDTSGNLYAGGVFTTVGGATRNYVAKINANGTLNGSFNPNMNGSVSALALDPSGNLYAGGAFTTVGVVTRNRLAKINADGTLNTSYDPNMNNVVSALALDPLGNLYAGGAFSTVGGALHGDIAKINTDGSLNSSFNPTVTPTPFIYALTLDATGTLYAGGGLGIYYAVYNGVSLSNTVFDKGCLNYYPNPTTGVLNISYSKEITSVSVMNLLGQTVLTQNTNGMTIKLDMSSLIDGTYIVKIVSEGKTQSVKVVKGL